MKYDAAYMVRREGGLTPEQSDKVITDLIGRFERFTETNNIASRTTQVRGIDGRILCAEVKAEDLEGTVMYRFPFVDNGEVLAEGYMEAEIGMNPKAHVDYAHFMDLISIINEWGD